MTTSARRRQTKKAPAANRYWWFQGDSVVQLYDRLIAIDPRFARLEVRMEGDKMLLDVVAVADATDKVRANAPINDSRVCPPICP